MESANCLAAAGSLQSGVELPSLGMHCHGVISGNGGSLIQDSIGHLAPGYEVGIKETSASCL